MEKYRRWTDQATGINPFINAKTKPLKLTDLITSSIIVVIKVNLIALFSLPILISLLLQNYIKTPTFLVNLISLPLKLLNVIVGLWSVDDDNFMRWAKKGIGKGKVILSNQICIFDPIYYMAKLTPVKFILINSQQDKFESIGGLNAILRLLTYNQPFFNKNQSQNCTNLKTLIQRQTKSGFNCIIFYQGIRTNGLGTIKISKTLSKQIFNLERDYCIVHLKYTSAPERLFSMVSHPFILFLTGLGTCSVSLRVRCNPIAIQSQNSQLDLQKDLDNFLLANAAKLLDTFPSSYFDFLQFYYKSQTSGYTQVNQEADKTQCS